MNLEYLTEIHTLPIHYAHAAASADASVSIT